MLSKSEIRKPNIYIAAELGADANGCSAIPLAEAIEFNPFIDKIFILEALYRLPMLQRLPDNALNELSGILEVELQLADIFIFDCREGVPAELGYAIATGKPFVLYNPDQYDTHPIAYGKASVEVSSLEKLSDINFLSIMLQNQ